MIESPVRSPIFQNCHKIGIDNQNITTAESVYRYFLQGTHDSISSLNSARNGGADYLDEISWPRNLCVS